MTLQEPLIGCIDRCVDYLEARNIAVSARVSEPAPKTILAAYEEEFGLQLSQCFAEFYLKHMDGLSVSWEDQSSNVWGGIEIASLADLRLMRQQWVNLDHHADQKDFRYVKNRELAERSWRAMADWIPVWDEGNGDRVCVDLSTDHVVLHEHDWNDAGTGFNGVVLETDILTLMRNWSTRCFVRSESQCWTDVVSNGAVDWESSEFPSAFRVPPL